VPLEGLSEKADCVADVLIASLNPIVRATFTATPVDAAVGETEMTAGGVVSAAATVVKAVDR